MTKKPTALIVLDVLSVTGILGLLVLVLFFTPVEATMGSIQKIFYFHVASAWAGMLSFLIAAGAGIGYLSSRRFSWDWLSLAAVQVGVVFGLVAIISGMIWARPVWNTWWVWDPRLTTTTIMELIYSAYFILRAGLTTPETRARLGAVYAILSAATVPLTFFSIRLFRTIHPVVIAAGSEGASFNMSPRMQMTFITGLIVFTILLVDLIWHCYHLSKRKAKEQWEIK